MNRREVLAHSILNNLAAGNGRLMREDVLARIVALELAHAQVSVSEIRQGLKDLEERGKIYGDRDDYGTVRFVLTDLGRAELLARG